MKRYLLAIAVLVAMAALLLGQRVEYPPITSASQVINLFSGCSGTQYLGADGNCHTASGSGTVTTTGSPASGQAAVFSGTTSITGYTGFTSDSSGDVSVLSLAVNGGTCTVGTAGTLCMANGTAPTAASGYTNIWGGTTNSPVVQAQIGTTVSGPMEVENVYDYTGGSTYDAALTDFYILCDSTSASTITLPVTNQINGKTYRIKNVNTGACTINAASGSIDYAGAAISSVLLNSGMAGDFMYSTAKSQYLEF